MRPLAASLKALALAAILLPLVAAADETAKLKVIDKISIPDGPWDYASVDPASHKLLVGRGDGVMVIDLATKQVTATLVKGQRVHAAFAIPGTDLALSTNGTSNTATLFKIADGSIVAEIPTGTKPDAAIYDPSSGLVFVMNGSSGDATLIDPKQGKSVGTIAIGGKLEFAASDGAGHVFVNVEDKGELVTIDTAKRAVTAHLPLTGCEEPSGLAYDPAAKILVSACGNGVAKVVSATSGKQVATVQIGQGPDAVIWDAARKLFLIPCGKDGVLDAIAAKGPSDFTLIASIPTHQGARTGALDAATGRIYLPAADFETAEAGERPKAVSGSAAIFVVGE